MSLWAASRPAGGAWGAPVEIAVASGGRSYDVAIDAAGTATAVWHSLNEGEGEPDGFFVRASTRPPGGAWSAPVDLSGPSATEPDPRVALDAAGDATAIWTLRDPAGAHSVVESSSRPAGGAWGAAADLSPAQGDAATPALALDAAGDATAAWSYSEDHDIVVQGAYRAAGAGGWGAPALLWDDATDEVRPSVALASDPQGTATAIWSSFGPGGHVMRAATSAGGGPWSAPVELAGPDGGDRRLASTFPRVVAGPQGAVTATWSAAAGPSPGPGTPGSPIPVEERRLEAAHRPAGGAWGAPVELGRAGELSSAEIAAGPQGYVTALWVDDPAVRSRVFDPVAPTVSGLSVPASAVAGEPVAFSLAASDLWSAVSASWDFGDGGSATGATPAHCYSTPGERTVRVEAADGAGNVTARTALIAVSAGPAAAPGVDPCAPPAAAPAPPAQEPAGPGGPGQAPGGGEDPPPGRAGGDGHGAAPAPRLSGLGLSRPRWRAAAGATLRFTLDRPAQVRLRFARVLRGRRSGGRCLAVPRGRARGRGCERLAAAGTLRIAGRAGANAWRFEARVGSRALAPGRYLVEARAFAAGSRSAPASLRFTLLP
jgi:hypothetical protein